jgi:hypothetical protein
MHRFSLVQSYLLARVASLLLLLLVLPALVLVSVQLCRLVLLLLLPAVGPC